MAELAPVLADLAAETENLDGLVADLDEAGWATATPAPGWTIADQIAHLAWTDDISCLAATDPSVFGQSLEQVDLQNDDYVDRAAHDRARQPAQSLLSGWRTGRIALLDALRAFPASAKLPWFGPPMSPTTMATARLTETWAHGQDVADALEVWREPTERLRHIAHLGTRTREFAYLVNGRTPPAESLRIELSAPSGETWAWGPPDARQRVSGPALDFCLLVTQRRHRAELSVLAEGADADAWLDIAQAFAGRAGAGRPDGAGPASRASRSAGPAG